MRYDIKKTSTLIKNVINNKPCLREWDDLVSISHSDKFTEYVANRLLYIQKEYSDFENGIFLTDGGIIELQKFLDELQSADFNFPSK